MFEAFPALQTIPSEKFPRHIFIIPDGNGRWAKKHTRAVTEGHKKGMEVAEQIITSLRHIEQIRIVTLWGFSSDNWKREKREVGGLMHIFSKVVKRIYKEFPQKNTRFIHIGRKDRLPRSLQLLLSSTEKITEKNTGQIFCLALDFGGEDQTLRMLEKVQKIGNRKVTPEMAISFRDGKGVVPPADLLIRTSGEKRISDVGWLNGAPTELYFLGKLFPEMTIADIVDAIVDFSKRERRMGGRK